MTLIQNVSKIRYINLEYKIKIPFDKKKLSVIT